MMITQRLVWLLALLPAALPLFGQKPKEPAGPRAVSVLEWTSQGLRLVPISLMIDGRFYDATLYRANPVPMAVNQETVYEVQKSGEAIGDFTVTSPAQLPNGVWIGQGTYESAEDKKKKEEDRAKAAAAAAAVKPVDPKDERPTLRRTPAKPEEPASTASAPPVSTPSSSTPAPTASTPSPAPSQPEVKPAATPPPAAAVSDEGPVLRRGKPQEEQASKLGNEALPYKEPPKPPAGIKQIQVAISDAGPTESRPYAWKWQPDEEQKYRAAAEKLARSLVSDYARKTAGPEPGKIEISGWNAFDLAYNNQAEIVLTAKILPAAPVAGAFRRAKTGAPPPSVPEGFVYYITLVAQEDIYGDLQKNFVAVTDNKHLDAFPRYELIDAVDADGDHNGELLFRRVNDVSSSFVLFQVYGNNLKELIRVPEPREISGS